MQNRYFETKITRVILYLFILGMVTLVCVTYCAPAHAEINKQSTTSTRINNQDQFTDVAGAGQSIQATRTKNDYNLTLAGIFGLATLLGIGISAHFRTKRDTPTE